MILNPIKGDGTVPTDNRMGCAKNNCEELGVVYQLPLVLVRYELPGRKTKSLDVSLRRQENKGDKLADSYMTEEDKL